MTTKQIEQIKTNTLKAFSNLTFYGDAEKWAFLNGADQFRHAMYMQDMITDDENDALHLMLKGELRNYKIKL